MLPAQGHKRQTVEAMFDRIAPRYDALNGVLSLGAHRRWKAAAIDALAIRPGEIVVDLACGTGDLGGQAIRHGARVIGIDVSARMLELAGGARACTHLVRAEGERLPLADASCDAIACGFALRNFVSIDAVLVECARVLKKTGRIALLEVDRPRNGFLRALHGIYFDRLVPLVGGMLADRNAYAYLPESVAYLPDEAELEATIRRAGFEAVKKVQFLGGVAQLVTARRRSAHG